MSEFIFRAAREADLPALAAIYINAVDTLGPRSYSAGQIAAWRRWPTDEPDEFVSRVTAGHCRVAEYDGRPVAFAAFTPPDHLDFLYTTGEFAGRGLATKLHEQLEIIARETDATLLRTEASYLSRPVFNRLGYEVFAIEDVVRFGESFRRFLMRKVLRPEPPATQPFAPCRAAHPRSFEVAPTVVAEEEVTFLEFGPNNPGWFKGMSRQKTEGYFPSAWFSIDQTTQKATAQRDYDAIELTVASGDLVAVIEMEADWVRVMDQNSQIGWIPTNCAPDQA